MKLTTLLGMVQAIAARAARLTPTCVVWLVLMSGVSAAPTRSAVADQETSTPKRYALDNAIRRMPPPVSIRIDAAGVDAVVETREIVDGELTDPSGPWVVAWYRETARPGETGNVVMGGHVDYWGVGPSVFYGIGSLLPGAEIDVIDAAGTTYGYAISWVRTYPVATFAPEQLRAIVGPTESPSLTLITCGGEFDYGRGEYLARSVVRATLLNGKPVGTTP